MSQTGNIKYGEVECPSCENENAKLMTHLMDIPFYTDFLMISINCLVCGYKTSDFINATTKGYAKFTYYVKDEVDERTKVVKAKEGILSIPELGVTIEPLSDATTWIRNIEGILDDIEKQLLIVLKTEFDEPEIVTQTNNRLEMLNDLRKFKIPFTLIIEDPSGNSVILPAREDNLVITKE